MRLLYEEMDGASKREQKKREKNKKATEATAEHYQLPKKHKWHQNLVTILVFDFLSFALTLFGGVEYGAWCHCWAKLC